jgi:hypothetical protein
MASLGGVNRMGVGLFPANFGHPEAVGKGLKPLLTPTSTFPRTLLKLTMIFVTTVTYGYVPHCKFKNAENTKLCQTGN